LGGLLRWRLPKILITTAHCFSITFVFLKYSSAEPGGNGKDGAARHRFIADEFPRFWPFLKNGSTFLGKSARDNRPSPTFGQLRKRTAAHVLSGMNRRRNYAALCFIFKETPYDDYSC
jgi:hypothetical protein